MNNLEVLLSYTLVTYIDLFSIIKTLDWSTMTEFEINILNTLIFESQIAPFHVRPLFLLCNIQIPELIKQSLKILEI